MNGSINKQFTVWCADCVEWLQLNANNQKWFEVQIEKYGWKKVRGKGWVCPKEHDLPQ